LVVAVSLPMCAIISNPIAEWALWSSCLRLQYLVTCSVFQMNTKCFKFLPILFVILAPTHTL
jgi:predicted aminopeptidase